MNLSDVRYPADTKHAVRNLLIQEARRQPKPVPRWRKPAILTFAGLALAGTTAAGVYVALAPVEDKREVRCYFRADLERTYPAPNAPGITMPPYLLTGIMEPGFDAHHNPAPDDPSSGMVQITDPIASCSGLWDTNAMNPGGITADLIPEGFTAPTPTTPTWNGMDRDAQGNPLIPERSDIGPGHYVPHLTECVVENSVAVIPGPSEVCAQLGIPALEK